MQKVSIFSLAMLAMFATHIFAQCPNDVPGTADLQASAAAPPQARSLIFTAPIRHIGTPVKGNPLKKGGSAPFALGLRRIVPKGWSAWEGHELASPLPASLQWASGKLWYEALGDALVVEGLRAEINWNQRVVILNSQRATSHASMPPDSRVAATDAPSNRTSVAPAPKPSANKWQLTPADVTLRAALSRWAKIGEWTLSYEGQNYAFEAPIEVEGEFRDAVCAVLDGINAAIANDPQKRPLDAAFWAGNRVVRIFEEKPELVIAAPGGSCRKPTGAGNHAGHIAATKGANP